MDATASSSTKAYIIAVIIQLIYTGTPLISKVAFNDGLSTSVFVFYRQAAGSVMLLPLALFLHRKNVRSTMSFVLLLKLFLCALFGNTLCLSMYNLSLKFTSPTVASATNNSMPVLTFCLALLLRMEVVKPRSSSGVAKLAGVALCLAGVLVIAFYAGPAVSPPVNHHHRALSPSPGPGHHVMSGRSSRATWIKGTLLFLIGNLAWSLSIVWQVSVCFAWLRCSRSTHTGCLLQWRSACSAQRSRSSSRWWRRGTCPGGSFSWTSVCSPSPTLVFW
ncbi:hypothetical protein BS78_02G141200 [Paspalum vaginatum]|nr:hypothetical protein BS78_02G141200 [Paspalum vaginatum]